MNCVAIDNVISIIRFRVVAPFLLLQINELRNTCTLVRIKRRYMFRISPIINIVHVEKRDRRVREF